jgi:hypothetical protein
VKNRFKSLPFKCNLQRYNAVPTFYNAAVERDAEDPRGGALCKLTAVDP